MHITGKHYLDCIFPVGVGAKRVLTMDSDYLAESSYFVRIFIP